MGRVVQKVILFFAFLSANLALGDSIPLAPVSRVSLAAFSCQSGFAPARPASLSKPIIASGRSDVLKIAVDSGLYDHYVRRPELREPAILSVDSRTSTLFENDGELKDGDYFVVVTTESLLLAPRFVASPLGLEFLTFTDLLAGSSSDTPEIAAIASGAIHVVGGRVSRLSNEFGAENFSGSPEVRLLPMLNRLMDAGIDFWRDGIVDVMDIPRRGYDGVLYRGFNDQRRNFLASIDGPQLLPKLMRFYGLLFRFLADNYRSDIRHSTNGLEALLLRWFDSVFAVEIQTGKVTEARVASLRSFLREMIRNNFAITGLENLPAFNQNLTPHLMRSNTVRWRTEISNMVAQTRQIVEAWTNNPELAPEANGPNGPSNEDLQALIDSFFEDFLESVHPLSPRASQWTRTP